MEYLTGHSLHHHFFLHNKFFNSLYAFLHSTLKNLYFIWRYSSTVGYLPVVIFSFFCPDFSSFSRFHLNYFFYIHFFAISSVLLNYSFPLFVPVLSTFIIVSPFRWSIIFLLTFSVRLAGIRCASI